MSPLRSSFLSGGSWARRAARLAAVGGGLLVVTTVAGCGCGNTALKSELMQPASYSAEAALGEGQEARREEHEAATALIQACPQQGAVQNPGTACPATTTSGSGGPCPTCEAAGCAPLVR
jgi:hypothetical protein